MISSVNAMERRQNHNMYDIYNVYMLEIYYEKTQLNYKMIYYSNSTELWIQIVYTKIF